MSLDQATVVRTPATSEDAGGSVMRELLRRNAAGISLALVLAAVLVAPRWWPFMDGAGESARVPISPYAAGAIGYDETLYTASIRDAFDGQIPIRDQFLVNHRDDGPPQRSAIPHTIIGLAGRAAGGPFTALAIVTTLAAAAALLFLYALMLAITGSRLAAVVLMPLVLLAVHVLNFADGILPLRHAEVLGALLRIDPEDEVHAWTRFPSPILVLAPFFAAVLSLPKAVEARSRGWFIAAAVAVALLVYTYVFYWTALGLALAAWLAALVLRGERAEARRLAGVGVLALILALPELIVVGWAGLSLPVDARDRVGLQPLGIDTSLAVTIGQRLLIGAPFVIALLRRGARRDVLYVALFLAPLVLAPAQGVVPQQWHYQTQVWAVFAIPAFVAGGTAMVSSIRWPEAGRIAQVGVAAVAIAASVYVVVLQVRAVESTDDGFVLSHAEDAAFQWMQDHLDPDDTVVSPSVTTNLLLASLTPSSQYLSDGGFTYADDAELSDRMLRVQAAYGYSEEDMLRRVSLEGEFEGFPLNDPEPSIAEQERLLEDHLAFFMFSFEILERDEFSARTDEFWLPRYRELITIEDPLSAYPSEYLYCGHRERYYEASEPARGTFVRVVFTEGDVTLYEHADAASDGAVEFSGC